VALGVGNRDPRPDDDLGVMLMADDMGETGTLR
jgi:hypothetical protein